MSPSQRSRTFSRRDDSTMNQIIPRADSHLMKRLI